MPTDQPLPTQNGNSTPNPGISGGGGYTATQAPSVSGDPFSNLFREGCLAVIDGLGRLVPTWNRTAQSLEDSTTAVRSLAHAAASTSAPITVPLPDEFKGSKEKADSFIRQCELYFSRVNMKTDREKIGTAIALIKGDPASSWADTQLELIQEESDDALETWKEFAKAFKKQFGDLTPEFTAQSKIKRLYQGKKTVEEYNAEFNALKAATKYNEAALIDRYRVGLDHSILAKLFGSESPPKSLHEWQERASRLDKQAREFQTIYGGGGKRSSMTFAQRDGTQPAMSMPSALPTDASHTNFTNRDPNAMDIDSTAKRPPLTCFNCGKLGHRARFCRLKPASNSAQAPTAIKVVDVDEMSDEQKKEMADALRERGF